MPARTRSTGRPGQPGPPGPPPPTTVGVIVPYDMALDHELWRWTPDGVSLLFTRTPFVALPVTVEMAQQVADERDVRRCVEEVASARPSVYAYACTSGSFVYGSPGERRLVQVMQESGGAPAVTTSGALLEALRGLGAARVAVATPYVPAITQRLNDFLAGAAIEVVGSAHLGLSGEIWEVPYATTAALVRDADSPDADAVVVSCTNLPTYDIIGWLEDELGKPVVTANQATMWAALRTVGREAVGEGRLLLAGATP